MNLHDLPSINFDRYKYMNVSKRPDPTVLDKFIEHRQKSAKQVLPRPSSGTCIVNAQQNTHTEPSKDRVLLSKKTVKAWEDFQNMKSKPKTPRKTTPPANQFYDGLCGLTKKYFSDPTGTREDRLREHEYLAKYNPEVYKQLSDEHRGAYRILHNVHCITRISYRITRNCGRLRCLDILNPA
jgi:hypothetical protein